MKTLRKIGNAILTGLLHAVFFLWGGVTRLLYFPRVEWTDKSAKDAMKQGAILISNHKSHQGRLLYPADASRKTHLCAGHAEVV